MHRLSVQESPQPVTLDSNDSTFIADPSMDFKILADLTRNSPAIFVSEASDKTDQITSTNSSSRTSRSSNKEDASTCITGLPPNNKIVQQQQQHQPSPPSFHPPTRYFDSSFTAGSSSSTSSPITPTSTSTAPFPISTIHSLPPPFPEDYNNHHNETQQQDDDELMRSMHTRSFSSLLSTDAEPSSSMSTGGFAPMSNNSRFIRAIRMAKKRRGSIGEGTLRRQKAISVPVEPRLTKSSIQTQQRYSSITTRLQEHIVDKEQHRMWDPHIDAFEILRAKITGITRTMQEFHVQELFQDELSERRERRVSTSIDPQNKKTSLLGHRRIRSHGSVEFMLHDKQSNTTTMGKKQEKEGKGEEEEEDSDALNSPPPPPPAPTTADTTILQKRHHGDEDDDEGNEKQEIRRDIWSHLRTDDDFQQDMLLNSSNSHHPHHREYNDYENEEEDEIEDEGNDTLDHTGHYHPSLSHSHLHHHHHHGLIPPTSPNLTALFLTTNSLINSRLDELSETASIASSCDLNNSSSAEWRSQFLELVSSCITQSEGLESLSTELLGTERRVRELLVADQNVHEQYHEREKVYEERIRECEEVAKQQLLMIDTLEELTADLEMKMEQQLKQYQEEQELLQELEEGQNNSSSIAESIMHEDWDFRRAIADIIGIESKDDLVHKMRWEVGMLIGGGVGTGHVIHTFEGRLRGIEMMIAGTGTTTVDEYSPIRKTITTPVPIQENSNYISHTIRHTQFHHHHYLLHLLPEDRKTRFRLIPRAHWVPDQLADHCQFERSDNRRCPQKFNFFQRRHHCRRCGKIICQRHSSNRLPLFTSATSSAQWSRVCDQCFCNLIVITTQNNNE
ncbi:hypothetical protein BDA99DRAFT_543756 [Phascolomyces articulosus]|uniref:FYVE-type domain-containing protein n=1 Tax=Phascolomyces articulosus TaxID=60185 RepID=A0AAD5P7H1_9FUNG|nr:hypothetical protein BDA99DRAFT_543756 [Phascolomyces articulosus]